MKRYFFSLALALLAGAVTYSASMKPTVKTDSDGHVLTALWAQYEAASKADKPKTEAEILTRIREAAEKDHLPVDFYDAATRYVSSVQRRDWKQRETLRSQLSEQVKAFDEPIVTFLWMQDYGGASTDELWAYVKAHENGFQGAHKPFFRNVDGYMGGALKEFIASDREYVLWRMLERRSYDKIDDDQVYRDLRDLLGDSYPDGPYLAYYRASHLPDKERTAAWQALADQYAHKAVALYPRQDLLTGEFSALTEKKASAAEFKALYDRALAYEKERGAFKGDEALIAKGCTAVKNLATRLTAQAVSVGVKDGEVRVFLKNVSGVDVILYDGDNSKASVLRKWSLKNPQGSFYVTDTLETALPALGDGDYYIEAVSGKNTAACSYSQHTLSIATRQDARGLGVYVTDYQSGKPLDKVSLKLWKGDRLVLEREGFTLDGFTLLPEKFRTTVESNARIYYSLSAETGSGTALRTSGKISARPDNYSRNTQSSVRLNIYRDRGAYNPGDTMQFKAILYQGHPAVKFETLSGKKLTAVLSDPEGNEIQRKQFTTNEFGSISGAFYLPEGKRNGYWSLEILNGKDASWDLFRVDEFVLPTFDLSFLPGERLYLPGDEVTVSGRLQSYSGHNLSGARLSVRVEYDGTVVSEQELVPDADNAFTFVFRALDSGWYGTTVTVTDATGETHEFFHSVFVVESISVSVDVQDAAPGEFLLMDENQTPRPVYYGRRFPRSATSKYLLSGDLLRMTLQVNNVEGEKIPLPVSYVLTDAEDREVRRGTVDSGTQVEIDLSDCKSGVYKVRAWASTKNARGGEIKDEHSCSLLLLRRDDTLVDAPVRRVFSAGEREVSTGSPIRFQFGCVDGEQWAIVTLFGLALHLDI